MQQPKEGDIVRGFGKIAVTWTSNQLGVTLIHAKGLFHLPYPADGNYIGYEIVLEDQLTKEESATIAEAKTSLEQVKKQRTEIGK